MRYWAAFSPLSIDATLIGWDIEHLLHNYQQLQSKCGWDIEHILHSCRNGCKLQLDEVLGTFYQSTVNKWNPNWMRCWAPPTPLSTDETLIGWDIGHLVLPQREEERGSLLWGRRWRRGRRRVEKERERERERERCVAPSCSILPDTTAFALYKLSATWWRACPRISTFFFIDLYFLPWRRRRRRWFS